MTQKTESRPTLRSLSEVLGLATSTVSLALRDSPEIAEDTRRRVRLAADHVGYRPNRAGVRLRTGKTNVITVVLNPQDEGSGFFSDFVFGIADGLSGTPYHLVVTPYSLSDPMAPIRYIVETGAADGVILSRTQPDDPRIRYLLDNNMPFATHGRTEMGLEHPFFDYDNENYAFEALRRLAERGRKRIALLGPPRQLTYSIHTNRGFEKGLRHFSLVGVPLGSTDIDAPLTATYDLGRQLAAERDPPDGFVASAVSSAAALAAGLRDGGLAIGKDFDVVSKHSTTLLKMTMPELISIPEDFRGAGRGTARLVIASISERPVKDLQIVSQI
jgi:LacI family transcriptional regulator